MELEIENSCTANFQGSVDNRQANLKCVECSYDYNW